MSENTETPLNVDAEVSIVDKVDPKDPASTEKDKTAPVDQSVKKEDKTATEETKTAVEDKVEDPKEEEKTDDDKTKDKTEDQTEDSTGKTEELDTATWGSTGDEVGDSILLALQGSKITPEEATSLLLTPMLQEDGSLDLSKIDRAAVEAKLGKATTTLVLAGMKDFANRRNEMVSATVTDIHSTVGGTENWTKIVGWANKNMPADRRAELSDLVNKGGAAAKFAATEFLNEYNKGNATSIPGTVLSGDSTDTSSGEAISASEYYTRISKAERDNAPQGVKDEIRAARRRGRAKNI